MKSVSSVSHKKISQRFKVAVPTYMEVIKWLVFCKEVAEVITTDLRKSTAYLSGNMVSILPLVSWTEYWSMHGHCTTDSSNICVSAWRVKIVGFRAALNHVHAQSGTDLAAKKVISRLFSNFEKNYHSKEIKSLEWNSLSGSEEPYSTTI